MANVNEVRITGKLPFHICESDSACLRLGIMNTPSYGLKITYGHEQKVPLENGGKDTYYDFVIEGREAIWTEIGSRSIKGLIEDLIDGGACIRTVASRDIEIEGEGEPREWKHGSFPTGPCKKLGIREVQGG